MKQYSPEDFEGKIDSMYRLVILGARRAAQVNRPETRPLVSVRSRKPTVVALDEIASGKVGYVTGEQQDEAFIE